MNELHFRPLDGFVNELVCPDKNILHLTFTNLACDNLSCLIWRFLVPEQSSLKTHSCIPMGIWSELFWNATKTSFWESKSWLKKNYVVLLCFLLISQCKIYSEFRDDISHLLRLGFHLMTSEVNPSKLNGCWLETLYAMAYLKSSTELSQRPRTMNGLYFLQKWLRIRIRIEN